MEDMRNLVVRDIELHKKLRALCRLEILPFLKTINRVDLALWLEETLLEIEINKCDIEETSILMKLKEKDDLQDSNT